MDRRTSSRQWPGEDGAGTQRRHPEQCIQRTCGGLVDQSLGEAATRLTRHFHRRASLLRSTRGGVLAVGSKDRAPGVLNCTGRTSRREQCGWTFCCAYCPSRVCWRQQGGRARRWDRGGGGTPEDSRRSQRTHPALREPPKANPARTLSLYDARRPRTDSPRRSALHGASPAARHSQPTPLRVGTATKAPAAGAAAVALGRHAPPSPAPSRSRTVARFVSPSPCAPPLLWAPPFRAQPPSAASPSTPPDSRCRCRACE